jgi:hypothetical protein
VQSRTARSSRQLRRFHRGITHSDEVFGTHSNLSCFFRWHFVVFRPFRSFGGRSNWQPVDDFDHNPSWRCIRRWRGGRNSRVNVRSQIFCNCNSSTNIVLVQLSIVIIFLSERPQLSHCVQHYIARCQAGRLGFLLSRCTGPVGYMLIARHRAACRHAF